MFGVRPGIRALTGQRVITDWNRLPHNLKEVGTGPCSSSRLVTTTGPSRGGWELTDEDDAREDAQHPTISIPYKSISKSHCSDGNNPNFK